MDMSILMEKLPMDLRTIDLPKWMLIALVSHFGLSNLDPIGVADEDESNQKDEESDDGDSDSKRPKISEREGTMLA